MAERFPYKVLGGPGGSFASEGVDYAVGDTVELPIHVAREFRWQLEPLSDAGRFEDPTVAKLDVSGLRDHEKAGVLKDRKAALEEELDRIDAELERIGGATKEAAPAAAPATPPKTAGAKAAK